MRNLGLPASVCQVETKTGGLGIHRKTSLRRSLYTAAVALALSCAGLAYLAAQGFTYYDNGQWVRSNLLAIYAKSLAGYG